MANIRKRDNGTYQAQIYAGRDWKGKKMYRYATCDSLRECKAAARKIEQEISDNKLVDIPNMRFSAWAKKWLELNQRRLSPDTYLCYCSYVKKHFTPYFGNFKMYQINEVHIKDFINKKLEKSSQSTVHKLACVLNEIFRDALKKQSPMSDIKIPKSESTFKPHIVADDEFQKILDAAHKKRLDRRDEIIVLLGAKVGLRRSEIFAIKKDDLFELTSQIRIDEARIVTKGGYTDHKPKSKKSDRIVTIPKYIFALINEYLRANKDITDRIFPLSPSHFSHYFGKMMDDVDLPDIRFHDLRHYRASTFYLEGIPDQYVADYLGHDIMVLKQVYQHLGLKKEKEIDHAIEQGLL